MIHINSFMNKHAHSQKCWSYHITFFSLILLTLWMARMLAAFGLHKLNLIYTVTLNSFVYFYPDSRWWDCVLQNLRQKLTLSNIKMLFIKCYTHNDRRKNLIVKTFHLELHYIYFVFLFLCFISVLFMFTVNCHLLMYYLFIFNLLL